MDRGQGGPHPYFAVDDDGEHKMAATVPDKPVLMSTDDVHEPSSNAAAVVTYAADPDHNHCISGLAWSYSADPTNGSLKIEDGSGNTVFAVAITAAGTGFIPFNPPKAGSKNTAMIITLAAGGTGVTGKLSVCSHWLDRSPAT